MADDEIRIKVTATDQASSVIGGVETKARGLGSTLQTVGGIAGGFLAANVVQTGITAFTGFLSDSTAAARESIQVQAQLNAVIESTGGVAGVTAQQATELAASIEKLSLFEDEAILSGENLLLTFTNIGADVFPRATQSMVDMSQALGQDLSSSAVQLGKALNDPINGITALSRVGVSFTEEQKELIRTMTEAGDIAGAQAVILAELEREFSGSAQAASDAAGAQEVYKDKMNDLQEQIGTKMIPIQEKLNEAKLALVTVLADKVIPLLEELYAKHWPAISQAIEDARPVIEFFVDFAVEQIKGFAQAVEGVVEIISGVVKLVDAIFHGEWSQAWDAMKQIASGAVDLLLGSIKAQFGNLPSILYNAGLDAGKAFANGILDAIGSLAGSISDALGSLVPDVGGLIPGNAGGTSSFAGGLTWVGERGPELVRLPGGSSIYSNAESKQMGGGVSVTINGNVYAGSVDEAKNSLGNVGYGLQLACSMRGVAI